MIKASDTSDLYGSVPFASADPLTWRLAVELVRRHPKDLWILRTFPMNFYDCLAIRKLPDVLKSPTINLNRAGTSVLIDRFDGVGNDVEIPLKRWPDAYAAEDPRSWIVEVEAAAGLVPPMGGLPPSTRSSIVLRWIAAFLAMQIGSRPRWSAWNDWAALESEGHPESFEAVPAAAEWVRSRATPEAGVLVWFIGVGGNNGTAKLALSVDGDLWRPGRRPIDLYERYRSGGSSLTSLVVATAGSLLP